MVGGLLTPGHLLLPAIIALLCVGPKRLPELGRSLGSGLRGFRGALDGRDDEAANQIEGPPASEGSSR